MTVPTQPPPSSDDLMHRDPNVIEEPLDAANQSLADALRASFGILKLIMLVLVVLFLFSNVQCIGSHEQALVLRLGRLLPNVHEAGLLWQLPYPIDDVKRMPTRKSNEVLVASHTFRRLESEKGKPLELLSRSIGEGLDPTLDGALLTADSGLVHVQWKVTYKFDNLADFVSEIEGNELKAAEKLIRTLTETVGVQLATEMTAEELIRTQVEVVQSEMRRRLNERLVELRSGIVVTLVELYEPTPPLQIRGVFDETQRAENAKQRRIRAAEKEATQILSGAAGSAHRELAEILDAIDRGGTAEQSVEELRARLDHLLENQVEGKAGEIIEDAGAYQTIVVSRMQSDVELYRTLLPEFKTNPALLFTRLWEQTRQAVFSEPGVTILRRPVGLLELRVKIEADPEQQRRVEEERLQQQKFDVERIRPKKYAPLPAGYD